MVAGLGSRRRLADIRTFLMESPERTMKAYRYLTGKDDDAFCHRVNAAINAGWELYGAPTLTFDSARGIVVCGQAITKEVRGTDYSPALDLRAL